MPDTSLKPVYKSKAVWLNIIALVLLVLPQLASAFTLLLPEQAAAIDLIVGILAALGNGVLRIWHTDTPIDTPKARAKRYDQSGTVL